LTAGYGAVAGLVLAAGAGRRMGTPKALLVDTDGPRLVTTVEALVEAGCDPVSVVLGAASEEAHALLGARPVRVVQATDWAEGMGASLRSGLRALAADRTAAAAEAVLVTLVDLPDVGAPVMRRVLDAWAAEGARPDALVRATYAGRPGHPVLLGRDHWEPLVASLAGDTGAQPYLRSRKVHEVSCEDLATGRDVDRPADLRGEAEDRRR
jgi:CTP:molybdopterin cytidylyltransferase MocA